jgi:hypothetical protein
MVFDPARVGQNCEFCGSPALVDYQEIRSPIRPQGVLPFRIDAGRVRDDIKRWWRSRWFAPGNVPGVDNKGRSVVRRERRVRWEPASGVVDTFFDDEAVSGTQGLPTDLLRKVEPFPTKDVVQYDTAFLSGHVVEHYQVVLLDAAQRSLEQMNAKLVILCARQIPGDTHRNLQIFPEFSGRTFKHVLVPVWLLKYDYATKPYQVIVNGYTGAIAGRHPLSFWKIALLVLLAALVTLIVLWINSQQ